MKPRVHPAGEALPQQPQLSPIIQPSFRIFQLERALLHNSSLLDGLITTEHTEKRKKDLKFPSVLSVISVVNLIYATTPLGSVDNAYLPRR
ncbi:MAG TPA: hypothetical protein VLF94_04345 [Chlamydiales bacterium]|nr:hypothetical protein [Chlamydiales bacterium]